MTALSHRRPPPPVGPGPGRLPVDDRRASAISPAVRRRGPCATPRGRRRSTRTIVVQTRHDLARDPRVPGDCGRDAVHRRRGRLGGPDRPAGADTIAALRAGPGGRPARRDPPPGPRRAGPGWLVAAGRPARARGGRPRRPRLTTSLIRPRDAGLARDGPCATMPDVRFVVDHLAKPPIPRASR